MVICRLCGEDVPSDNKGMGLTLVVVHENHHATEMKRLGMNIEQYVKWCKKNYGKKE